MTKTLQIANIIALIITIVMNYLSNTGVFNGNMMASVSDSYRNLFTPAGYAFSIWGVIYIGLAAFAVHQGRGLFYSGKTPKLVSKIGWTFVISCAANCLWILAWLYDYTGTSVLLMVVLLLCLVRIVIRTRMELDLLPLKQIALEWWPFAVYLGWIVVALVANVAAYLTKIKWDGFGIPDANWTIIMMGVATLIYVVLIWIRNLRESAMVGVWALAAIAVANWDGKQVIVHAAISAAVLIFVNVMVHAYLNKGRHFMVKNPKYKRR